MSKTFYATIVAAALIAAAVPPLMLSADAQPAAPTAAKTKKPQSASQVALRERQRKCGAEWKVAKSASKVEKGMNWPQYWSACNKRLKSGG
jgi:hypothetical protein